MSTDKLISKIGLGTVQFGLNYGIANKHGQTKTQEVRDILAYAKQVGIDTIDTANGYGTAESVLGENDLSQFKVISKFILQDATEINITDSLKKLNISQLYGYLSHNPIKVLNDPKLWNQMVMLKEKGLVKKIGLSLNTSEEADKLLSLDIRPDLIQVPFNYFDARFKEHCCTLKVKYKTEIHSRSTFLQGLFFCNVMNLPTFFDPLKDEIQRLQTTKKPLAQQLLNYSLSQKWIDKTIIGVNNLSQLKQNCEGVNYNNQLNYYNFNFDKNLITPSEWPRR